jgi:succinate dehydrogenase/fumarate reductase flavoprotein subunit
MASPDSPPLLLTTQVLVIGGGLAADWVAITAASERAQITHFF